MAVFAVFCCVPAFIFLGEYMPSRGLVSLAAIIHLSVGRRRPFAAVQRGYGCIFMILFLKLRARRRPCCGKNSVVDSKIYLDIPSIRAVGIS